VIKINIQAVTLVEAEEEAGSMCSLIK